MAKVTEALSAQQTRPVFICDMTPPRAGSAEYLRDAAALEGDFICVAYNPGKAVRADSVAVAASLQQTSGRGAVFNLSPRDMNRLALESRLLGAQLLGLENVLVIQGDAITERDGTKAVSDYTATELIAAIARLNTGVDYKGSKLRTPTGFCIGASIDLSRDLQHEAELTRRKVEAGADFFVTQPVWQVEEITRFQEAYAAAAGAPLATPVCWGLQILAAEGVLFANVPQSARDALAASTDGVDIALETYKRLLTSGLRGIYLVSPILKGGARDYEAANRFLRRVSST
jgi:5,10-methylenetetrahydrofolate reductase